MSTALRPARDGPGPAHVRSPPASLPAVCFRLDDRCIACAAPLPVRCSMTTHDTSAVVITRNQAWNVDRLLGSVLREPSIREVVLVDSASTDKTIESALRFPVRVIQLRPDQRLSAAAGRHVGLMHTTGAQVLFLDGDTELHPGWLERAIDSAYSKTAFMRSSRENTELAKPRRP